MPRQLLFLTAIFFANFLSAQWSVTALASGGGATVHPALDYIDLGKGTVLGVGAEVAYGFGGRVDRLSLRVQYDRYRDFNLHESYNLWNKDGASSVHGVYHSVTGWRAWQLTAGVEGPFFLLKNDARLRMHVRAGLLRTGSVDVYSYALKLSDDDNPPSTRNIYNSLDDDPERNALEPYRMVGSYGLSYRITPVITASFSVEQIFGNLGDPYTLSVYTDGQYEDKSFTRFGKLQSFRLEVAAQLFGDR